MSIHSIWHNKANQMSNCIEFGLGCEYQRERKKRGKASRKDLAQQAAAQAAAAAQNDQNPPSQGVENSQGSKGIKHQHQNQPTQQPPQQQQQQEQKQRQHTASPSVAKESAASPSTIEKVIGETGDDIARQPRTLAIDTNLGEISGSHQPPLPPLGGGSMDRSHHLDSPTTPLDLSYSGYDSRQEIGTHMIGTGSHVQYNNQNGMNYPELPYPIQTQSPTSYGSGSFRIGTSHLNAYSMGGEAASPAGWMSLSSPTQQYQSIPQGGFAHPHQQPRQPQTQMHHTHQPPPHQQRCRYPVIEPLIPHLSNIVPISLACDLIDLYFASSSSAKMHPMSPYVLGFVFRKRSFIHPDKPRSCQPALLASILWVAAQTSDAPFLSAVPSARSKVCQKLLELTVSLLKPLIHTPSGEVSPISSPVMDGLALGGLGVAVPGSIPLEALSGESGPFGAAGSVDDVVTYIHLATVVSASEYKGASLRWWNAAWSLARELKLGRELPPSPQPENEERGASVPGTITEEEREERRRVWWLVYIMDRHLALCYNRPLFLLDLECDGLLQPMDDTAWQNGEFKPTTPATTAVTDPSMVLEGQPPQEQGHTQRGERVRGPSFECTGHSIFGYFLPLMAILGEIVDLHHARNHPRFGVGFRPASEWDEQANEICRHLEVYEQSLKRFEARHLGINTIGTAGGNSKANDSITNNLSGNHEGESTESCGEADVGTPNMSVHSVHTSSSRLTEQDIQTRIVLAYGTHVMHVLHILLAGKWDPINLLDDNDLWISSQGFITATGHAVSAAEAISDILEFDPGLEFMPFFFGIYLLQGSFLLLLIADKLQLEASPSVVKACETIIRAHEACVVTLSTEYQVSLLAHSYFYLIS